MNNKMYMWQDTSGRVGSAGVRVGKRAKVEKQDFITIPAGVDLAKEPHKVEPRSWPFTLIEGEQYGEVFMVTSVREGSAIFDDTFAGEAIAEVLSGALELSEDDRVAMGVEYLRQADGVDSNLYPTGSADEHIAISIAMSGAFTSETGYETDPLRAIHLFAFQILLMGYVASFATGYKDSGYGVAVASWSSGMEILIHKMNKAHSL